MINIYVNGEQLDVCENEVSVHFANFRFAGAIQDQYTTDITMPKTSKNVKVLGAWGLLSRPQQTVGSRIRCSVEIGGVNIDGNIAINKVSRKDITATLYLSLLPYDALDKQVNRVVHDTSSSIVAWNKFTPINSLISDYGVAYYDYGVPYTTPNRSLAQLHPYVRLNTMLADIASATGIAFDSVAFLWQRLVVATKKNVCPYNEYQVISESGERLNGFLAMRGGQHVCNNINPSEDGSSIIFNRSCTAQIQFHVTNTSLINTTVSIKRKNSGGSWSTLNTISIASHYHDAQYNYSSTFDEGDEIAIECSNNLVFADQIKFLIKARITSYSIAEEDFGKELIYIADTPQLNGLPISGIDSYCYFGIYANMPDFSIRDLLNSISWFTGRKVSVSGSTISFISPDTNKDIQAEIADMSPVTDVLGKRTIVKYQEQQQPQTIEFTSNDFLSDEAVLHESIFHDWANGDEATIRIPQYSLEGEGIDTKANFAEVEGVAIGVANRDNNQVYLAPMYPLALMGIDSLGKVAEINGSTMDNIADSDFVTIDGRKFLIIEGDKDVHTGVTNFRALLTENFAQTYPVLDLPLVIVESAVYYHNGNIVGEWSAEGVGISQQALEISNDGGATWTFVTNTTGSFTATGLTYGDTYQFRAWAENGSGRSYSNTITVQPYGMPQVAITSASESGGTATVVWTASGIAISDNKLQKSTDNGLTWTNVGFNPGTYTGSVTIGTTLFRAYATNPAGTAYTIDVPIVVSADYLKFSGGVDIEYTKQGSPSPISLEYSTDGVIWTSWAADTRVSAETVWVRGSNASGFSTNASNFWHFVSHAVNTANVSGNIMTLLDWTDPSMATIPNNYCFAHLFEKMNADFSELTMPADTLNIGCYLYMFADTMTPRIPALPAKQVDDWSYAYMFSGCTELQEVFDIAGETIGSHGMYHMFDGCNQLTNAYFVALDFKQTDALAGMFLDCVRLTYIKVMFEDWRDDGGNVATTNWVQNVGNGGTLAGPAHLPETYDNSHIPTGWGFEQQ